MRTTIGLVGLFAALCSSSLLAQPAVGGAGSSAARTAAETDALPFAPFLERSRYWLGWPTGAMYEGDVNLPVPLFSRTAALMQGSHADTAARPARCLFWKTKYESNWRPRSIARGERITRSATGCTLTFVPHFVLRQLKHSTAASSPVRTPSFNPLLELAHHQIWFVSGDSAHARPGAILAGITQQSAGRIDSSDAHPRLEFARLITTAFRAAHYSNGQAGCLYRHQAPDSNSVCRPSVSKNDPGAVLNDTDGSFSTHYLELGSVVARLVFDSLGRERYARTLLDGSIRWYPAGWIAKVGGMDRDLARTYGRLTLRSAVGQRWRLADALAIPRGVVVGWSGELEIAPLRAAGYRQHRESLEAFIALPQLYGAGLSLKLAQGWDYYNVGYDRNLPIARPRLPGLGRVWIPTIGITLDHTRALALTPEARQEEARKAR